MDEFISTFYTKSFHISGSISLNFKKTTLSKTITLIKCFIISTIQYSFYNILNKENNNNYRAFNLVQF